MESGSVTCPGGNHWCSTGRFKSSKDSRAQSGRENSGSMKIFCWTGHVCWHWQHQSVAERTLQMYTFRDKKVSAVLLLFPFDLNIKWLIYSRPANYCKGAAVGFLKV